MSNFQSELSFEDENRRISREIDKALEDTADHEFVWGWRLPKIIADLSLLTRTSYLMLVIVPLLAGIWPGVSSYINSYNSTINFGIEKIQLATDKLNLAKVDIIHKDASIEIDANLNALASQLGIIKTELQNTVISSDVMPSIWVWIFVSSLLAVVAQLVYQSCCPETVKRHSLKEYISARIDDVKKVDSSFKVKNVAIKAKGEYRKQEISLPHFFKFCLTLYTLALILISYIICYQLNLVINAAGWKLGVLDSICSLLP